MISAIVVLCLLLIVFGTAPLIYYIHLRWKYRNATPSPESEEEMQTGRYNKSYDRLQKYPGAIELQLAVNRAHNLAIKAKVNYELLGIAVASGAPGLILLHTFKEVILALPLITNMSFVLMELAIIILIGSIAFLYSRPSDNHFQARLRSEILRVHLHAYLVRVGPYANGNQPDMDPERGLDRRLSNMQVDQLKSEFRKLETIFFAHKEELRASSPSKEGITPAQCEAYIKERTAEQDGYFAMSFKEHHKYSERAIKTLILTFILAIIAGVVHAVILAIMAGAVHEAVSGGVQHIFGTISASVLAICSAICVWILQIRTVFGWDAKHKLYEEQYELIAEVNGRIRKCDEAIRFAISNPTVPGEIATLARDFRIAAAEFESLMCREASDFGLVAYRSFYDVGF